MCPSYECNGDDVGFHFKTDATDVIKGSSSGANIMHICTAEYLIWERYKPNTLSNGLIWRDTIFQNKSKKSMRSINTL